METKFRPTSGGDSWRYDVYDTGTGDWLWTSPKFPTLEDAQSEHITNTAKTEASKIGMAAKEIAEMECK